MTVPFNDNVAVPDTETLPVNCSPSDPVCVWHGVPEVPGTVYEPVTSLEPAVPLTVKS